MSDSSDPRRAPGHALTPIEECDEPGPPDYNPVDYRWVPVRRIPRRDDWTEEKQRRFIEVLANTGLVNRAAKAVGMSRGSAHRLRRSPQCSRAPGMGRARMPAHWSRTSPSSA